MNRKVFKSFMWFKVSSCDYFVIIMRIYAKNKNCWNFSDFATENHKPCLSQTPRRMFMKIFHMKKGWCWSVFVDFFHMKKKYSIWQTLCAAELNPKFVPRGAKWQIWCLQKSFGLHCCATWLSIEAARSLGVARKKCEYQWHRININLPRNWQQNAPNRPILPQ